MSAVLEHGRAGERSLPFRTPGEKVVESPGVHGAPERAAHGGEGQLMNGLEQIGSKEEDGEKGFIAFD